MMHPGGLAQHWGSAAGGCRGVPRHRPYGTVDGWFDLALQGLYGGFFGSSIRVGGLGGQLKPSERCLGGGGGRIPRFRRGPWVPRVIRRGPFWENCLKY